MSEKPDIVKQYERRKEAGESLYFDPVELEDMFHYYAEEGSMEQEEEILRLAQTLHPDDIVTHTLAAEWALSLEDAEGCLRELEEMMRGVQEFRSSGVQTNVGEEVEDSVMYCILKSGALALKGDVTGAIEYGEKALEGDDPLIAYDVGLGFMNANQPTIALRYFDRCLEAFPNDLRTLQGILYCLNLVGTVEEIIRYADRALEVDSYCVEAWLAKGNALGEQGKWKEAEECCDYAMAIQPENGDCILMKVNCCVQQNRYDEALEFAVEASKRVFGEAKAQVLLLAAHLYAEKQKLDEAVECVWKAVEACPTDKELMTRAAVAFSDYGASREAIALLEDRVGKMEGEELEDMAYLLSLLGEQYTKLGSYEAAAEVYEKLVRLQPSAATWTLLAGTYMSLNKFRKAYQLLQKANAEDPIWQTYVLASVCAHESGWETAAATNYRQATQYSAKGARELLKALSPLLVEEYEKEGIISAGGGDKN